MMDIIDKITKFGLTCDAKTEQGVRHFHCGHEYVEIGGIKWATMNIGATSPTESGLYFQWGDTQGYTDDGIMEDEKYFNWASYKYWSTSRIITKYNATDAKTVLDAEDDAVSAAWGGGWRMPTSKEFKALHNAVNAVWATDYQGSGINGLVLTDKKDSSKVLFFPAAGYAVNGSVGRVGTVGFYWSSSLDSYNVNNAYYLYFGSKYVDWGNYGFRYGGCPVRGIVSN